MAESAVFRGMLDAAPTWRDLEWLRAGTRLPILLKGVTDPEDALRAAGEGMAGIVLSNHGGRALDTLPATIDLLPPMAERLGGQLPILLDGGIRRGTDIVKALALGAKAVLVGRPVLHALAVGGLSRNHPRQITATAASAMPVSRPSCPASSSTTSSLPGQARCSSQAVASGLPRSSRPWISTPGMPASRSIRRSRMPSSSQAAWRQ